MPYSGQVPAGELSVSLALKGQSCGQGNKTCCQDLYLLVEGGNQPMATLQKGSQGTKFLHLIFLLPLTHQLVLSITQTKSEVRGWERPLIKSIKINFLAHRAGWESVKNDSRRKNKKRRNFQHNSPYFIHRNQWQHNVRFLQILTGLAILLLTCKPVEV